MIVRVAFVFGLQTLLLLDFTKIFQLNGLKPKKNGQANFYECCDLTKKVYLNITALALLSIPLVYSHSVQSFLLYNNI